MALMPRPLTAQLGRETVEILRRGGYAAPSNRWVDLSEAVAAAVSGTAEYPPTREVVPPPAGNRQTTITVENATVLEVGERLAAAGPVAALNFASATAPGGGFRQGARAQEESIARSSGLFACLEHQPMYGFHRRRLDAMFSDYVIYSPQVPVFRRDSGGLLEQPWMLSIITCPAADATALREFDAARLAEIPAVMAERTRKALAVAAHHQQYRIILGAWGCGAFGIESTVMAQLFHQALTTGFRGVFDHISFAITDWSEDRRFIGPFAALLARS